MSHVATIDVKITDLTALKEACRVQGWEFREGQKTYKWYGQVVGAVPPGMNRADMGKCTHAIRVPGADYEVGIRANADGTFALAWDYWSYGGLSKMLGGDTAPLLVQTYATEKLKIEARRLGHAVESQEALEDGSIRLRLLAAR